MSNKMLDFIIIAVWSFILVEIVTLAILVWYTWPIAQILLNSLGV